MDEIKKNIKMTIEKKQVLDKDDLTLIVNIIDVCSKRGAFLGKELKDIGTLTNKILNILEE